MLAGALQDAFNPLQFPNFGSRFFKFLPEAFSHLLELSLTFRIQKHGNLLQRKTQELKVLIFIPFSS